VEAHTAHPRIAVWSGHPMGQPVDPNPFVGRVLCTHGIALDRPARGGADGVCERLDTQGRTADTRDFEPVTIVPLWNSRGQPVLGAFADGTWRKCMTDAHCIALGWPEMWSGYSRPKWQRTFWHGTLLEDKADGSGLNYRRNRYYDPVTGRFTPEDPGADLRVGAVSGSAVADRLALLTRDCWGLAVPQERISDWLPRGRLALHLP
jgi:hypothetical protein